MLDTQKNLAFVENARFLLLSVGYEKDVFAFLSERVEPSQQLAKKSVATVIRREGVYNRTGKAIVTFCEKGGTAACASILLDLSHQNNHRLH